MSKNNEAPVLDANGDEVDLPEGVEVTDGLRAFMAGRVPASECPHYIAASEARGGFTRCERCSGVSGADIVAALRRGESA